MNHSPASSSIRVFTNAIVSAESMSERPYAVSCCNCGRNIRESIHGCADLVIKTFVRATAAAFAGTLLAMMFGGAEIAAPDLWILWGMLAAGRRHAWLLDSDENKYIYLDPSNAIQRESPEFGHLDLASGSFYETIDTPYAANSIKVATG